MTSLATKTCSGCEAPKELESFPPDKRRLDGRGAKCRDCARKASLAFYSKYPAAEAARRLKNSEAGRRWYQKNRVRETKRMRSNRLVRVYGLTDDEYNALLGEQGGGCAICKTTDPGRKDNYFAIDHDHETGAVRGLLCQRCNCGVGFLADDPSRMRKAAEYVERSREKRPHKPESLQAA